jgi:hypothetical protein
MPTTQNIETRNAGGRPPKFGQPSRPITVTLPESTLEGLRQIHPDRGQAIVKLTSAAMSQGSSSRPLVEIVDVATKTGVLIIGPCEPLRNIPFLHLVEVAPGRFLLALAPGNDFRNLEIAVNDVLEELPEEDDRNRELILQLLASIRGLRKAAKVSMAEIVLVSTGS